MGSGIFTRLRKGWIRPASAARDRVSWRPMAPMDSLVRNRNEECGAALILVLIFTVLLFALIADLVTTARTSRLIGENDALIARMSNHMRYTLSEIEQSLLDDLQAGAAGGEGEGGPAGLPIPGAGGGGAEGAEGEEEEEEAAAVADCSQDAWYQPTAYSDDDLTTYVWVEDENRKFNVLSLVSPDEEFARESQDRFVRLIDVLREDTDFDLTSSDGELMAEEIKEWMKQASRNEYLPRPNLKSDDLVGDRMEYSLPMHLDDLMLLRSIDADMFYDKVLDSRIIPGLESVLTIYTSLAFDPGNPEKLARQAARNPQPTNQGGEPSGGDPGGDPGEEPSGEPGEEEPEQVGLGILININTASRAVLRSLMPEAELSNQVLDAILRYRNEEVEEEDGSQALPDDYMGEFNEGSTRKLKCFTTLDDLDEIPEFENLGDPKAKDKFKELLTTKSDVFSIHFASLYKRSEEHRVFVIRRARSIVVRQDDGEEGYLHPLIMLEERHGLRIMPMDFTEDEMDMINQFDEMDDYSQEERAWNPFYLDFYKPKHERERLFNYSQR